jgi:lipoprotein NlpD
VHFGKTFAGAVLLAVLLAGCGGFTYHRVQPGETLYSISWRYGRDYREVARWNHLSPPYTIYEGQPLRVLPPDAEAEETAEKADTPAPVVAPAPVAAPQTHRASPPVLHWQWPARGTLLQTFSESDIARKGIDIGGTPGEAILAAAAGKVVYAGSGLRHYGKLIILKHDDNYLSAYAYNRTLRVREGDTVTAGQRIADMGGRNGNGAMLHFEIRYDGRPVNPLSYLPASGQ